MQRRPAVLRAAALVILVAFGAVAPASAQTAAAWPERPLRVVLPFPPGGPSDIVMRQAAEKMQVALKQPIVVDNKPGALLAGPTVLPHVRAGKLVALAVSGSRRSPTLPDVPTMAEAGVAGYQADFTLVMLAPRGVPEPILARFRQAFVDALNAPDLAEKLKAGDQTVVGGSAADAAATLAADSRKWGAVARRIQLGLD